MDKLLNNKELYNYLKENYTKTYYVFETLFGKRFPYKKFTQSDLDSITSLKLKNISSTVGIDELKNLKSLSIKDIPDLSDVDNLKHLSEFKCESNNDSIDTDNLLNISNLNDTIKFELFGKDVKNIPLSKINSFGRNTFISYNHPGLLNLEQFYKVQLRINELKSLITPDMSEIQIVKTIYSNMLTDKFEFNYNNHSANGGGFILNNTLYGPLVENTGVCSGVSAALKATLENVGIEAHSCGGWLDTKPSAGHAHQWNQVKVDGKWYNLDLTNDYDRKSWIFFMKSDTDLDWIKTHYCEKNDKIEKIKDCTSTKYDKMCWEDTKERKKKILKEEQKKLEQKLEQKQTNLYFENVDDIEYSNSK